MKRRNFLWYSALAAVPAWAQEQPVTESATASATADATPRVGIVPSDYAGSQDHDGTEVKGLPSPQPVTADVTAQHIDAMVRKAIELGGSREGGFKNIIEPDDWVVVKTHIPTCHGLGPDAKDGGAHSPYIAGSVTDLRIVHSLLNNLAEAKLGLRFTIAEGSGEWLPSERSKSPVDGWTTDWGGAFGGLSYTAIVKDLSAKYPKLKFEIIDLNFDQANPMPVPVGAAASNNKQGTYLIPQTIQQCDKLISVAPLKTDSSMGVSLTIGNYLGIAPGSKYGFPKAELLKLGQLQEIVSDLFAYHPADFAILGGGWGIEGDGPNGKSLHHNLLIAGANAVAVDSVAASVMGFDPAKLKFLDAAELSGFGIWDSDSIWVRGREIEEARRPFQKPSKWNP